MSLDASIWAWEQAIPFAPKLVLLALAEYANHEHECWPSVRKLAGMASMSPATIFRALTYLEENGLIRRTGRERSNGSTTSNIYLLLVPDKRQMQTPNPPLAETEAPRTETPPPSHSETGKKNPPVEPVTTTARARQMPDGFAWNNAHSLKATAKGVNVDVELEKFRDYHLARASKFVDWDRAFHTWLNNARPEPGGGQRTGTRPAPRTPTDRMNAVLSIQDPNEQRALDG